MADNQHGAGDGNPGLATRDLVVFPGNGHESSPLLGQHKSREGHACSKRKAKVAILLVAVLYFAGIIPNIALQSQYLVHRLSTAGGGNSTSNSSHSCCSDNSSDGDTDDADTVQAEASTLTLHILWAMSIPALLANLFLGGFADVIGRRPFVLIATFTGFLRMLLTSLIILCDLPLWVFYLANGADGVSGSWYILFVAIFASVADINAEISGRVYWMALLGAVIGLDNLVFNTITGVIINSFGFFAASLISTACTLAAFLATLILFQETLTLPEKAVCGVTNNVRRILGFFLLEGSLRQRLTFLVAISFFFFAVMNALSPSMVDPLYQMHSPFCWSSFYIGLYLGLRMGGQFVAGLVLLKLLQRCLKDEWIAALGLLCQAGSFVLEALITESWMFSLVPIVGTLGVTAVPIARGLMSSLAGSQDQGAVFSSVAVVEVTCLTISNTAVLQMYSSTVATMAGAVYFLMAALSVTAALLVLLFLLIADNTRSKGDMEAIINPPDGYVGEEITEADDDNDDNDNDVNYNRESVCSPRPTLSVQTQRGPPSYRPACFEKGE